MTRERLERLLGLILKVEDAAAELERASPANTAVYAQLTGTAAKELSADIRDFLGDKTPPHNIFSTSLMQRAPDAMEQVPAWISGLAPGQVDGAWVGLLTELAFTTEGAFRTSRTALALAMAAVRDGRRAKIIVDQPGVEVKYLPPPSRAEKLSQYGKIGAYARHYGARAWPRTPKAWREWALKVAPNAGDVIDLFARKIKGTARGALVICAAEWPEFRAELRYGPGGRKRKRRVLVRVG